MVTHGAGVSDIGNRRKRNEDAMLVDDEHGIYAVADGMGGCGHGDVASSLALETLHLELREMLEDVDEGSPYLGPDLMAISRLAVLAACRAVHTQGENNPEQSGMGTTLTLLLVRGGCAVIAHVGDSRLYRMRASEGLVQLTNDHNVSGELFRAGIINREMLRIHPQRHILTRCVGPQPIVDVDVHIVSLSAGDRFVLCSDGVSDLANAEMEHSLSATDDTLEDVAFRIVERALLVDGTDNTTAVVVEVDPEAECHSQVHWRDEPTWDDEPTLVVSA